MKLRQNEIESFIKNPNQRFHLVLIYGNSAEKIRESKKTLIANLGGQALIAEMRLVSFSEKEILSDQKVLFGELKTRPFFAGPKIIVVENVTDSSFKVVQQVIQQKLANDEALLILVGNNLTGKSTLKNLLENQDRSAITVPLYKREMNRSEIRVMAETRGLKFADETCFSYLEELSNSSESLILKNTLDKLQLCFLKENISINLEHIESIQEEEIAQNYFLIIDNVVSGNLPETIKEFRRYAIGRQNFSGFVAFLTRYFRNIENVSINHNHKTPYFGKAQEKFMNHVKLWPQPKVKNVIRLLLNLYQNFCL